MCCLSKAVNCAIGSSMFIFIGFLLLVIYSKCIDFPKDMKCDDFLERVLDLFKFN